MKSNLFRNTLVATLLLAASSSFTFASGSAANEFAITPVENLYLGKNIEKVWTVAYSEQEKPVTITLEKHGNTKEFVVRSEFFEVVYESGKAGFGVKSLEKSSREVPSAITKSILNRQQLYYQRIISPEPVSDVYALQLIASYLPDLLNEGYRHLIY
jgi:hypothetical protein